MRQRITVFALSAAGLMFELAAVRVVSFVLPSQYAYMVLAMAVLGGGLGAALVVRRWRWFVAPAPAIVGSLFLTATVGLLLPWPGLTRIAALLLFSGLPHFAVGAWLSRAFAEVKGDRSALYAADLIGAATGVAVGYLVLQTGGPLLLATFATAIAGLSVTPIAAPGQRIRVRLVAGATLLTLAASIAGLSWLTAFVTPSGMKGMSSLMAQNGAPLWTGWNAFGRVDIMRSLDPDRLVIYTDGSAPSAIVRFDKTIESTAARLASEPGSLPFLLAPGSKTLLIGPGGGKDIVMAGLARSQDITAVEVNPLIVQAVTDAAVYSGNPYHLPQVKVVIGDGRAFVRRTSERYDLIYLSLVMTDTAERTGWGLSENYIYTSQAISDYLDRLQSGGQVALVLHQQSDLVRAVTMALMALTQKGETLAEATRHLAVFTQTAPGSSGAHGRPIMLITREPITSERAAAWRSDAAGGNAMLQYLPGEVTEGPVAQMAAGELTITGFIAAMADHGLDASLVTDNRPYFYATAGGAAIQVKITLIAVLAIGLVISRFGSASRGRQAQRRLLQLAVGTGVGYMLVEVTLMQLMRSVISEPTLAVVAVLLPMLAVSGLGALVSGRIPEAHRRVTIVGSLVALAGLLAVYPWLLGTLSRSLAQSPLSVRLAAATVVVGLPSFVMGFPYPRVLSLSQSPAELWMVNGIASVIGSIVALLINMMFGLSFSLLLAAGVYGLVSLGLNRTDLLKSGEQMEV